LLVAGVSLLVAFALVRDGQAEERDRGVAAFYDSQREPGHLATLDDAEFGSVLAVPDQSMWSQKRVQAYQQSLDLRRDVPLAVLSIDRLKIEAPVYNGADELNLNRGVARIKGTASVTAPGNLGIAGHRDGFFRGLKDAQEGDLIRLRTAEAVVSYRVTGIDIVDPSEVSVLAPTDDRSLTLVTCYPFYFVGPAPRRYIVKAHAEEYLAIN
jgi:sortase A